MAISTYLQQFCKLKFSNPFTLNIFITKYPSVIYKDVG